MSWVSVFAARLRGLFVRSKLERDLDDEVRFHLEMQAEDNLRAGMDPAEARYAARRSFGGVEPMKEQHREGRALALVETIRQDVRYALRTMRASPVFFLTAILIVGLGIGASSTVFSVVNALLLRPLPFSDPGRLVWVANDGKEGDLSNLTHRVGSFLDLREHNKSFSDLAAYFAFYGVGDSKLTGTGEPERLSGVPVSQNFFSLLGVQPLAGRLFSAEECKFNGPKAVLLSYGLWKRRFASDPAIVGRNLTLNNSPVTVSSCLPASFY